MTVVDFVEVKADGITEDATCCHHRLIGDIANNCVPPAVPFKEVVLMSGELCQLTAGVFPLLPFSVELDRSSPQATPLVLETSPRDVVGVRDTDGNEASVASAVHQKLVHAVFRLRVDYVYTQPMHHANIVCDTLTNSGWFLTHSLIQATQ